MGVLSVWDLLPQKHLSHRKAPFSPSPTPRKNADRITPQPRHSGAPTRFHPSRKLGEWQVYDIRFRSPRRGADGKIVGQGEISAWLNGRQVLDKTKFGEPRSAFHPFKYETTPYLKTIAERQKKTDVGPLFLQDHGSPCRFRNIWVVPLDDRAFLYEPK